jgi:TRAP-type transport system small permease protein
VRILKSIIQLYRQSLIATGILLVTALFLNVILQVFSRSFLVSVPPWTEEVGSFLLVWLVAIGSGVLFLERKPIAIDFIYEKLPKIPKFVVLVLNVVLSIWFLIMLVIGSLQLTEKSGDVHSPALNLPFSYVFSSLIVAGILMAISIIFNTITEKGKEGDVK